MKPITKFLNKILTAFVHLRSFMPPPEARRDSLLSELSRITAKDAANYASTNFYAAKHSHNREDLWAHALNNLLDDGIVLEFGVWQGNSINFFASRLNEEIHGFDSFIGLKEDWPGHMGWVGRFSLNGKLPKVRPNVTLHKGWFDETLPVFMKNQLNCFKLIHIDCDTYESTKIVLELIQPKILVGSVIIFDEYIGYRGWRYGEYKAWQEHTEKYNYKYEYLFFTNQSVSVRVTDIL